MEFTTYYSQLLKTNGRPHFDLENHKLAFNIISLELRLDELHTLEKDIDFKSKRDWFNKKMRYERQLNNLTHGLRPQDLVKHMLGKSGQLNGPKGLPRV